MTVKTSVNKVMRPGSSSRLTDNADNMANRKESATAQFANGKANERKDDLDTEFSKSCCIDEQPVQLDDSHILSHIRTNLPSEENRC